MFRKQALPGQTVDFYVPDDVRFVGIASTPYGASCACATEQQCGALPHCGWNGGSCECTWCPRPNGPHIPRPSACTVCAVPPGKCETAFGYFADSHTCFLDIGFKRWGWTNEFPDSLQSWTIPLYAGAGKCVLSKGVIAGHATITNLGTTVTVVYSFEPGWSLDTTHTYVGVDRLPKVGTSETVAPGQYPQQSTDKHHVYNFYKPAGPFWVVAHATVCK